MKHIPREVEPVDVLTKEIWRLLSNGENVPNDVSTDNLDVGTPSSSRNLGAPYNQGTQDTCVPWSNSRIGK